MMILKERFFIKLNIFNHKKITCTTDYSLPLWGRKVDEIELDWWGGDKIVNGLLYANVPFDIIVNTYQDPKKNYTILYYQQPDYMYEEGNKVTEINYAVYVKETPEEIYKLLKRTIHERYFRYPDHEQYYLPAWREDNLRYFRDLLKLEPEEK